MTAVGGDAPILAGLLSACVPFVAGWPLSGLSPRVFRSSLVSRLAMAWLLGAAWCGVLALAASRVAGLPMRRTTLLPIVVLPLVLWAFGRTRDLGFVRPRRPSHPGVVAGVVAAATGGLLVLGALSWPVFDWDGRMTWSPLARLVRMERTATPSALTDPWAWTSHPRYPPLVALVQVTGLEIVSAPEDERSGRAVHPLFFVSFLAILFRAVRALSRSPGAAAIATSLASSTPFLAFETHGGAAGAFSDMPLAALLGAALAVVLLGRAGIRTGAVAGLLLAAAVLTKNEGLPLALWLLLAAAALAAAGLRACPGPARRARFRRVVLTAVPIALFVGSSVLLLEAFRDPIPNRYDEDYGAVLANARLEPLVMAKKAASVLPLLLAELTRVRYWGLLWPLLGFLAVLFPRALSGRAAFSAAALLAGPLGLGFVVYSIHWDPLGLADTTLNRFLVQGSFGAFLLLGLLLAAGLRRPLPGPPPKTVP